MITPPLQPLNLLLRTMPDRVHTEILGRLFNHLLKGQWITEQLVDLDGKKLNLKIDDANTELLFQIKNNSFMPIANDGHYDVRIKGSLEDFWKLATRQEDPDTLFFKRSLALEGDTETGLYIKNMLDALEFDWETHVEAVLGSRAAFPLIKAINSARSMRKPQITNTAIS